MAAEAPRPSPEVLKTVDFYNPVADRIKTLGKLIALSTKEPTDEDLFQVIADTFAIMATANLNVRKVKVFNGNHQADEVTFDTPESDSVSVGYLQQSEDGKIERWEGSFIEGYSPDEQNPGSVGFERNADGSIEVFALVGIDDDKIEYSISAEERKKIIKVLLQGINFQELVTA